ncbi:MAG: GH3 auxin-responsive promoter family protein [Flavobacteriales bacterium]|nr:GH3 auxin-responsive promoter family protein [Flavobacteriales bacterium]
MGVKAILARPFARMAVNRIRKEAHRAAVVQEKVLRSLVKQAQHTRFGEDHGFESVTNYGDFRERVPIRDYEELKPYIERILKGEQDVLWPGMPLYFCKTSGTTSGAKYIPLTRESMPNHIGSARNALLSYIAETGDASFVNGKMIFLQGSPKMDTLECGVKFGRLSGIVANHVPGYLLKNRMPSYATNTIEDWETKVDAIVEETLPEDMTVISGIPSWVQMYFERLIQRSGKATIGEVFPNFGLFVFGGVNFEPYRNIFRRLIGKDIPSIELYPASEGFIAYQDSQVEEGMLLVINSGIFYEFIPTEEFHNENPTRLSLRDVQVGVNYVIILNTNAGLWGYNIGDTVKFVSLDPPRIKVTGRIKHFTSAFGEHVIGEEVERAMTDISAQMGFEVKEFHVAPQLQPSEGLPYHEWLVEFSGELPDLDLMAKAIDAHMQRQNPYYRDLLTGSVLRQLVITPLPAQAFNVYMKSIGKLGGQNKVPRLANDRKVADGLLRK